MSTPSAPVSRLAWPTLAWLLVTYGTILFLSKPLLVRITQEDSFFENLTCLGFLAASLVFLYLYLTRREGNDFFVFRTRRNIFFLLLAALFFFCAGEEISWGQRIFGTQATGVFADNLQHETTIHNLPIFEYEAYNEQGQRVVRQPGFFRRLFRHENLINVFCYSWCGLVPLTAMFSARIRRFWQRLNVPIVSLWLGGLLLLDNLLLHVGRLLLPGNSEVTGIKIVEIKECGQAVLFFVIGLWFLMASRPAADSTADPTAPALAR